MFFKKRLPQLVGAAAVLMILVPASTAMATYTPVGSLSTTDANAAAHPLHFVATYNQEANSAAANGCTLGCAVFAFPEPDVKKIVTTFPRGVVANPKATPYCTPSSTALAVPGTVAWSCPDNTIVGTETITALVCSTEPLAGPGPPYLCSPTSLVANVHNAAPGTADKDGNVVPGEQGHLVVIKPYVAGSNIPNARLDINYTVSGADTMTATADNIPTIVGVPNANALALGGCDTTPTLFSVCFLHISKIEFDMLGQTGGNPNYLISNPTYCGANSVTGVHTSTASAGFPTVETATNTAAYTTTNCDAVPFDPKFIIGLNTSKRGAPPAIVGTVFQEPNEAAITQATITLPKGYTLNTKNTLVQCPVASQGTGQTAPSCAADTRMGNATINAQQFPDVPGPLFGDAYLGVTTGARQFNIVANTGGFLPLVVSGDTGANTATGEFVTEFRDLPQATPTWFRLNLAGGNPGLVRNPSYCAPLDVKVDFLSHSGKTATATSPVAISGCASPDLDLSLSPSREGSHPTMTLNTSSTGTVLGRVTQRLTGGIRWKANISKGTKTVLGRVWLTTYSGSERVNLKQSTSSKSKKKGQVLLTGKRDDGAAMKFRVYRTKKGVPQITMSGQPAVSTALTGVKLRLYGEKGNWLTLPPKCKRMHFRASTTDAYGKARGDAVRRNCKS